MDTRVQVSPAELRDPYLRRPPLPALKFEEDVIGWGIPMFKSQGRVV
jgi:hypothetical protein